MTAALRTSRVPPLMAACLAIAAVTLLFPSSPTYDAWAWIVWGREVLHLDLRTVSGPSWKPLPVLFTTVFSLFGTAAPALWLVVARAGGLAAVAVAFVVARRVGGVVAGACAAAALLVAPWFVKTVALGNSEGLMVAAVLAVVWSAMTGSPRRAFAWGVVASLMRPEAWPFLGLLALWLLVRDRGAVVRILAAGIGALPLLWFLPELWGSGNLLRAADRAQHPLGNSAAFSRHPFLRVLQDAAELVPTAAWIGVGLAAVLVVSGRVPRERARPALAIAALALLWAVEVAVMTERGFSGNQRYLMVPAVLMLVVGAAGVGWTFAAVVARGPAVCAAVAAVGAVLFGAQHATAMDDVVRDLRYQGALPHELAHAVSDAGGATRLLACGTPYSGPFLVPAVAWQLHVHTSEVGVSPRLPAVVFVTRISPQSPASPSVAGLPAGRRTALGRAAGWEIVGACR